MKKQIFTIFLAIFAILPTFAENANTYPLPFVEQTKILTQSPKAPYSTLLFAKSKNILKDCDFWLLSKSGSLICGEFGKKIYLIEKNGDNFAISEYECKNLQETQKIQKIVKTLAIDDVDFCKDSEKSPSIIIYARDDFGTPHQACAFSDSILDVFYTDLSKAIKTQDFSKVCKFNVEKSQKKNLEKFLAENFGVKEKIDFDAMFEEIKTYGKANGLCSQLSQVLYDEKKCSEIYKFASPKIHSCDGFYIVAGDYVIFCPSLKDYKFFLNQKESAVAPQMLTQDFAILPAREFFKYHTSHEVGLQMDCAKNAPKK